MYEPASWQIQMVRKALMELHPLCLMIFRASKGISSPNSDEQWHSLEPSIPGDGSNVQSPTSLAELHQGFLTVPNLTPATQQKLRHMGVPFTIGTPMMGKL